MLTTRILRLSASAATRQRFLHTSRPAAAADHTERAPGRDPQLSQGHASIGEDNENRSAGDVQSQSVRAGKEAASSSSNPLDAASGARRQATDHASGTSGNPESIGFQEQIGGKSAEGSGGEMGGREEAQAPGVYSSVKQALGFKTDAGDIKQNQGGGRGVTGTGTARKLHTSAGARGPAAGATQGQAPAAARQPHESTHGDQNAHLSHKSTPGAPDSGKGNAGETPTLPSERVPITKANAPGGGGAKRGLHTSVAARAPTGEPSADPEQMIGAEEPEEAHTADTYLKDVDRAPGMGKTYQVDSSSAALDKPITDAEGNPGAAPKPSSSSSEGVPGGKRGFHTSARAREQPNSGPFSQSGPGEGGSDPEYQSVSREAPYDKPIPDEGPERQEKLRYGGTDKWNKDKGGETSDSSEGPDGSNAGGRKA